MVTVPLLAQTGRPTTPPPTSSEDDPRALVTTIAPIYLLPDASRKPLRTAALNTVLRVLESKGPWLKVEFHDSQYGRRQGYVLAQQVQVKDAAAQQPMDLLMRPARTVVAEGALSIGTPVVLGCRTASPSGDGRAAPTGHY
jgi:hypothetical protein